MFEYQAEGTTVTYTNPVTGLKEVFLTVHPIKSSHTTTERAAEIIADLLNDMD